MPSRSLRLRHRPGAVPDALLTPPGPRRGHIRPAAPEGGADPDTASQHPLSRLLLQRLRDEQRRSGTDNSQ